MVISTSMPNNPQPKNVQHNLIVDGMQNTYLPYSKYWLLGTNQYSALIYVCRQKCDISALLKVININSKKVNVQNYPMASRLYDGSKKSLQIKFASIDLCFGR